MQFKYASNFGPSLTTRGEFRADAAARSGRWELESCRVRGTLKVP